MAQLGKEAQPQQTQNKKIYRRKTRPEDGIGGAGDVEVAKGGDAIVGEIKIVNRKGTERRRAESYIIDGKGVYVVGLTSARTPHSLENIEKVAKAIREGTCTTKDAARELLAQQL